MDTVDAVPTTAQLDGCDELGEDGSDDDDIHLLGHLTNLSRRGSSSHDGHLGLMVYRKPLGERQIPSVNCTIARLIVFRASTGVADTTLLALEQTLPALLLRSCGYFRGRTTSQLRSRVYGLASHYLESHSPVIMDEPPSGFRAGRHRYWPMPRAAHCGLRLQCAGHHSTFQSAGIRDGMHRL